MKIIITEKQAEKLFSETIKCQCGHSWKKETNDQDSHLCHMCGWDQKQKKYNDDKLIKFWRTYKK